MRKQTIKYSLQALEFYYQALLTEVQQADEAQELDYPVAHQELNSLLESIKDLKKELEPVPTMYPQALLALSAFSGELVEVIGEQTVELDSGKVVEQYLYNIKGYVPENGKPFASLKANLQMLGGGADEQANA